MVIVSGYTILYHAQNGLSSRISKKGQKKILRILSFVKSAPFQAERKPQILVRDQTVRLPNMIHPKNRLLTVLQNLFCLCNQSLFILLQEFVEQLV